MEQEAYAELEGGAQDAMLDSKDARGKSRSLRAWLRAGRGRGSIDLWNIGQPDIAESLLLTDWSLGRVDT
jgi:hypothetical protein